MIKKILVIIIAVLSVGQYCNSQQLMSWEEADKKAGELLDKLSIEEKLKLTHGERSFFFPGIEGKLPYIYLSDASQGVNIRKALLGDDLVKQLEVSTAFPAPIMLASTFSPELAYEYAKAIGEECRAGGVEVLLGPGVNIYRNSRNGRNFEYFGEDPYLVSRLAESYITGMQSTGTASCMKHFLCNQTEFYRKRSNSVVSERALHEIYLPAFQAGVDAGVAMIMTAYNQLNGEWCGQSEYVIKDLLRRRLGFKGGVMSDWTSIYDWRKVIQSGQNIEMPGRKYFFLDKTAEELYAEGLVSEAEIERMIRPMLATCIAFGLYDRDKYKPELLSKLPEHKELAQKVASEGIVLLENNGVLPIKSNVSSILLTGKFLDKLPAGLGSAEVKGYDIVTMAAALKAEFGSKLTVKQTVSSEEAAKYDIVIVSAGTEDKEAVERYFALPQKEEDYVRSMVNANPNTIVIMNTGSGTRMLGWNKKAAAVLYAWYPGQNGMSALADVLSGKVNPSGKLPISIEREFADSPAVNTVPEGAGLIADNPNEPFFNVYDVNYEEGILVGYRWYDTKGIKPLYPFGYGLSYTEFEMSSLAANVKKDDIELSLIIKNTGSVSGSEVIQVYVSECLPTTLRPIKELKAFKKVYLDPGQKTKVNLVLKKSDLAFWDEHTSDWKLNSGSYRILIGNSSDNIILEKEINIK